ncbi:MAG: DNA replication and repair protein RecF [Chloroflexota bacterium]
MHVSHLSLTNVRNFVRLEVELPTGPLLVVGGNAQGKTSLLEALYYLAAAASPHAGHDRELINFLALRETAPFARFVGEVHRSDRLLRVEIRLLLERPSPADEPHLRREILINGVKRRPSELAGGLNAVLFLPQDLRVIEGPPAERRRYLDAAISQGDPHYAASLHDYGQVLVQRNALLKQLQESDNGLVDPLAFWDERLAALGASLIRARSLVVAELDRLASPIHSDLTGGAERLRLDYLPSYDPLPTLPGQLGLPIEAPVDRTTISPADVQAGMLETLSHLRSEEIQRGQTLIGPHRDDVRLRLNGIDLRTYGSRGQNRTAMLSLKLAEVEWMRQRTGEWPLLLLDEVLAELDVPRRQALLGRVHAADQAVLTSADAAMFSDDFRRRATIWHIENGTVRPL